MWPGDCYGASIWAKRLSKGVRVWPKLGLCCGMAQSSSNQTFVCMKKMLCDAKNFSVGEASPEGSPRRPCGQDHPPRIITTLGVN